MTLDVHQLHIHVTRASESVLVLFVAWRTADLVRRAAVGRSVAHTSESEQTTHSEVDLYDAVYETESSEASE